MKTQNRVKKDFRVPNQNSGQKRINLCSGESPPWLRQSKNPGQEAEAAKLVK